MVIELVDGPMEGVLHEVDYRVLEKLGVPSTLGLRDEQKNERYWYAVNPGSKTARYYMTDYPLSVSHEEER